MFERFTGPARIAVEFAAANAVETASSETRPEHLFHALLQQETCLAVRVLTDLGAPLEDLRAELVRQRQRYVDGLDADDAEALRVIGIDLDEVVRRIDRNLGGPRPSKGRPRFARSSKKVLELALREALRMRHNYIGTEHVLLGLARSEDRVVTDTLAAFDVRLDALRTAVLDALRTVG